MNFLVWSYTLSQNVEPLKNILMYFLKINVWESQPVPINHFKLCRFSCILHSSFMGSSKMLCTLPRFPQQGETQRSIREKASRHMSYASQWIMPWPGEAGLEHLGDIVRHSDTPSCNSSSPLFMGLSLIVELPECTESRQFHWGVFSLLLLAHWTLDLRTG